MDRFQEGGERGNLKEVSGQDAIALLSDAGYLLLTLSKLCQNLRLQEVEIPQQRVSGL
jgi:hypothetical protein